MISPNNLLADVSFLPPPVEPPPLEWCTRHPDVVTGRHCTRCTRPACNDCLVQASVGSQCIDCVRRARPPLAERMRRRNAAQSTLATRALITANVAVFLWTLGGGNGFGTGIGERQVRIGLSRIFLQDGEMWRIVTSGFLHFGLLHLAMNMLLLWQLGTLLEPALGRGRFLLLYLAALTGGALGAILLSPDALTGGASGAVFGLMGAAAVALMHRGINPLRTGIGTTLILNLFITFTIPGISVGGHLGGVIAGAAAGWVMFDPAVNRHARWFTWVAPVTIAVACWIATSAAL